MGENHIGSINDKYSISDIKATINQINQISSEELIVKFLVLIVVLNALKDIIKNVDVPIVADIHFHYKKAIEAAQNGAAV